MHGSHIALGICALATIAAAPPNPRLVDVRLVAESNSPAPGQTLLVGLQMIPKTGWHGYWSNPGENGLAPVVHWTAPQGVRFGSLEHPAPTLLKVAGLASFVHEGSHTLIARMFVAKNMRPGAPLPVTADVSFAACSDKLCVPQHVKLSLALVVGGGAASPDAGRLRRAAAAIPKQAADGIFSTARGKLVLKLPATLHLVGAGARFFPASNGYFDPLRAYSFAGPPIRIISPLRGPAPAQIAGVVSDGSAAYSLTFRRRPILESRAHPKKEQTAKSGRAHKKR